jgi:hypothetical protein
VSRFIFFHSANQTLRAFIPSGPSTNVAVTVTSRRKKQKIFKDLKMEELTK